MKNGITVLLGFVFLLLGCVDGPVAPEFQVPDDATTLRLDEASKNTVDRAEYVIFQSAGPKGPEEVGLLDEGSTWGPTKGSQGKLLRGRDFIQFNAHTTGLPPGVYTVWWGLINNPAACNGGGGSPCSVMEIFTNPASDPSVLWATGGIVQANGVGNFWDRLYVGEVRLPGTQHILGDGLTNPMGVEVFSIIKYHGPPSEDPGELWAQTHTLLGLCNARANALPNGQCFDPQWAIFRAE